MLTMQETFTIAKDHLLKQGAKANGGGGQYASCYYRDALTGRKCPVGALIQDAYYDKSLEGQNARNINVRAALRKSGVPVEMEPDLKWNKEYPVVDTLTALQRVHDTQEPAEWEAGLRTLAEKMSLKYDYVVGAE